MMLRLSFTIIMLLSFLGVVGQNTQYTFKNLSVRDGLSRNWVRCIYQDSFGFMWFGTDDGLNKYDGFTFRVYNQNSSAQNSLNHNSITSIYEDRNQNLWVGTHKGLNLYNRQKDEFIPIEAVPNFISCFHECDNGKIVIGSPGGLFIFDPSDLTATQKHNNIHIQDILADNSRRFWLATLNGLLLLDTTNFSFTTFLHNKNNPYSISENVLRTLYQDSQGRIWIGTDSQGLSLMKYNPDNPYEPVFINYRNNPTDPRSISRGAIMDIMEDERGNLWIGIENGGINIINLNDFKENDVEFIHLYHNPSDMGSISNNSIHCLYMDNQNTVWIGTFGKGLSLYNNILNKFKHYKHIPNLTNSLNNNQVNCFLVEGDQVWIGTEGGLNRWDRVTNTYQHYVNIHNDSRSIGYNAIYAIFRDRKNNLWVGTWSGGLNLFNEQTGTFTRFQYNEENPLGIGGNNVFDIIEDSNGYLWIAVMNGGLNRFDPSTGIFKHYTFAMDRNSVSNNWVRVVMESSYGELWVSTSESVDIFDRQKELFHSFTNDANNPRSISYNGAIDIFEDSNRNLWLGTNNGLNLFNRADSSFTRYSIKDGLPSNAIRSIVEDKQGNLWLGTNNGLSKFVEATKRPKVPEFINYEINDGLQGNEFNSRAIGIGVDGYVYIGGSNGFNVFYPDSITFNSYVPKVMLTDFLIYNRSAQIGMQGSPLSEHISIANSIVLKRKHSVFSIEFAALNFIAPETNQYAYMLEGFNKNWIYSGTNRMATFTNLDPGQYTFMVKACNNNGIWGEEVSTLAIKVLPAWWQTWWAKAFYASMIFVVFYFFRKYTLISVAVKNELWIGHYEKQKLEELNQMKFQFFTEISHELRTPLTLIVGPLNRLLKEFENEKESVLIRNNVNRLKVLVDQILDFRKVENEKMNFVSTQANINVLIRNTLVDFSDFAHQKGIQLEYHSSVKDIVLSVDEDKIKKIMSNLLTNSLKFTPSGGKVTLSLNVVEGDQPNTQVLIISVKDNGKGIREQELDRVFDCFYTSGEGLNSSVGIGIGLHLTKKFVELHGGTITVQSTEGAGVTFSIALPFDRQDVALHNHSEVMSPTQPINTCAEARNNVPHPCKAYSILIIDDNIELCDYLESILENEYNVIKEYDPLVAIDLISTFMPDVIISDVMMPGINGFELCKQVKTDIRFSHIPIILLTAKSNPEDHIMGYEIGADDYIYKPFNEDILTSRIRSLIYQRKQIRQHFIGNNGMVSEFVNANSLDKAFMKQIMNVIAEGYSNSEFDVNTIIEVVGMSRSVFYKKFKALSDQSITDIIRDYRIRMAEIMLKESKLSVSEVAYSCGFSDPAYFSRVFKEICGVAPKAYVEEKRKI